MLIIFSKVSLGCRNKVDRCFRFHIVINTFKFISKSFFWERINLHVCRVKSRILVGIKINKSFPNFLLNVQEIVPYPILLTLKIDIVQLNPHAANKTYFLRQLFQNIQNQIQWLPSIEKKYSGFGWFLKYWIWQELVQLIYSLWNLACRLGKQSTLSFQLLKVLQPSLSQHSGRFPYDTLLLFWLYKLSEPEAEQPE